MKTGSIRNKIFVLLLMITLLVVFSMALMMRFGIDRGFDRYKKSQEYRFNQKTIQLLADHYSTEGSWDTLRNDPAAWKEMIFHSAFKVTDKKPPPHRASKGHNKPPPPHHQKQQAKYTMKRMLPNYSVYDANKVKVVGSIEWDKDNHHYMKIVSDDELVGFLVTQSNKGIYAEEDRQFNEGIQKLLLIMVGIMAVTSLLLTLPIARYFTRPIQQLTSATQQAAAGDFSVRSNIRRNDELGQLSNHFNHLVKTLESNATSQKNMMADIAHELRTPLAVTLAQIEAIQDGIHQADEKTLGILHHQITTLNHLVNDLYELSLSDLGTMRYEMKSVDVLTVLKRAVNAFKLAFEKKSISCKFNFDDRPHQILGDDNRLCQLFYNILNNAMLYTDEGGIVLVSLTRETTEYVVVIEDSKPGLDAEQMNRMFDRLYRKESSRNKKSGGSGLGLAIAANIVKAHNGQITASSSSLGGVHIEIRLARV
ncbi:ATP-binding protein [Marinicella sediminis]|uniref:histidine kinase n=1 Tax=Marinicella sediminis TaxID=1792834 RepID=A0ABV7JAI3_9GAMM|nr:ATP-binding protein [Marinicella sediminis]